MEVTQLQPPPFYLNLLICFWLPWVFVALCGLSLVSASSKLLFVAVGEILLLQSLGSRADGFSSYSLQALGHRLHRCGSLGLVPPWHVGSLWIQDRTRVSCIGRWMLYQWATREAPVFSVLYSRLKSLGAGACLVTVWSICPFNSQLFLGDWRASRAVIPAAFSGYSNCFTSGLFQSLKSSHPSTPEVPSTAVILRCGPYMSVVSISLETWYKCRLSSLIPDLLNQKLWRGAQHSVSRKSSRWFW